MEASITEAEIEGIRAAMDAVPNNLLDDAQRHSIEKLLRTARRSNNVEEVIDMGTEDVAGNVSDCISLPILISTPPSDPTTAVDTSAWSPLIRDENVSIGVNINFTFQPQPLKKISKSSLKHQKLIGRGIEGFIYKATLDGRPVAVKMLDGDMIEVSKSKGTKYMEIFHQPRHENIIQLLGICTDLSYSIVMEFCERGTLRDLLNEVDMIVWPTFYSWAFQIASGMDYIHKYGGIHGDLRPERILVTAQGVLRIGFFVDFVGEDGPVHEHNIDSYAHMDPELVQTGSFSKKTDIYCFGILLWELLTMRHPYEVLIREQLIYNIAAGIIQLLIPSTTPPILRKLLEQCWQRKGSFRPSFEEIVAKDLKCIQADLEHFTEESQHKMWWEMMDYPLFYVVQQNADSEQRMDINLRKSSGPRFVRYSSLMDMKEVGQGSFGQVYSATLLGRQVAVKMLKKANQNEVAHLLNLQHEYIVKIFGVCSTETNHGIIMEYYSRTLHDALRGMDAITAKIYIKWSVQIATAVKYLHDNHVIHRDLKARNILLTEGTDDIRICDFGVSKIATSFTSAMSQVGTGPYMAPEALQITPMNSSQEKIMIDAWSYGVLLWEMLTRRTPFQYCTIPQLIFNVGASKIQLSIPVSTPTHLKNLIIRCLHPIGKHRPSFIQILEDLKSIYVQLTVLGDEVETSEGSKLTVQLMI